MSDDAFFFRARRGLPSEIKEAQLWIEELARGYGLDFVDVVYEMCDYDEINMIASYGGFPTRYPHWRFGMEYLQMQKGYEYGLQKIYEMVINTVPSYAYLLDNNMMVDQKLVMAHVCGHVDFFTHNAWFKPTNRKMLDQMANHAARVRRYIDRHGESTVEAFIDMCLSVENLIDPYLPHIRRERSRSESDIEKAGLTDGVFKLPAKGYMDKYINPPEYLDAQREKHQKSLDQMQRFPAEPTKDILGFIMKYGRMARWQQDVLGIIRDEAYYFAPQGQTKIMNEGWACVAGDTAVFTDAGLVAMDDLVRGDAAVVSDGDETRPVVDHHVIDDIERVTIRTRRGLSLTGSFNHRIQRPDNSWVRLDELEEGDAVRIAGGQGLWASQPVPFDWKPQGRITVDEAVQRAGTSTRSLYRARRGVAVPHSQEAVAYAEELIDETARLPQHLPHRIPVTIPSELGPELGAILGYLVGDGHISVVKRTLGLTTADASQVDCFIDLMGEVFGCLCSLRWDDGRWRVNAHSQTVSDFLVQALGLTTGPSAAQKQVPEAVRRSPEPVVRAFLRALFDCDGYAGKQGLILSTASDLLGSQVQLLLLNYGILSRRRQQTDGVWHVHITGESAFRYEQSIGFGLARKQNALRAYIEDRQWFKTEVWTDEVVSVETDRGPVVDITVDETHRYAAAGFINHNSYWHTFLMTRHILDDSEVIDYADHHSGTVAMRPGQLNPYKIGIELYRDIERRWNKGQFGKEWLDCKDIAVKRDWDTEAGLGREKIFEVRATHNDVTFIDNFLTEDFVRENGIFTYEYDKSAGHFVVDSREFKAVKQKILFMLSNRAQPRIQVVDGNAFNRGELMLQHDWEGLDMQLDWAQPTLQNLAHLWGRPVHLATLVNEKQVILSHDGSEFKVEGLVDDKKKSGSED